MKAVRLDRLLANLGYGSRKEVTTLIRRGGVRIAGERVIDPSYSIVPALLSSQCSILCEGAPLDPLSPLTVMLHKPAGYTCSHEEVGPLIYDLLPSRWAHRNPKLSSAGRLDKDSTGQVILTDDGDLLHRIIHPRQHLSKRYKVTLQNPLRGEESLLFVRGDLILKGEKTPLKPAQWVPDGPCSGVMVLEEGRYHQIRRMFGALGNHVTALHRFQTGGLALGDLPEGQYRILEQKEKALLFQT